jgi:hypothetical protein
MGIGTAGSLAGGIYSAATAKDRKRKFLAENQAEMLHNLRRQQAASLGFPVGADAAHSMQKLNRQADEQFAIDPMAFVPFVQNATKLAGGIYDAASSPGEQEQRLAPDPIARQQQATTSQQDALERAEAMKFFQQQGWQPYGRY